MCLFGPAFLCRLLCQATSFSMVVSGRFKVLSSWLKDFFFPSFSVCCGFDWGHGVWITLTGLVWYFTPGAKNEVGVHPKPQDFMWRWWFSQESQVLLPWERVMGTGHRRGTISFRLESQRRRNWSSENEQGFQNSRWTPQAGAQGMFGPAVRGQGKRSTLGSAWCMSSE